MAGAPLVCTGSRAPPPQLPVTGLELASQADEGEGPAECPAPGGLSFRCPCWEAARRVLGCDGGGEATQTAWVLCAVPTLGAGSAPSLVPLLSVGHTAAIEGLWLRGTWHPLLIS